MAALLFVTMLGTHELLRLSYGPIVISSMSVVYFLARNEPLSTHAGGNILKIFFLHSLTLLSVSIYNYIATIVHGGCLRVYSWSNLLMSVLYLFWLICGTLAVRTLRIWGGPLTLINIFPEIR
jgi:hypothetical protein